MTEATAEANVGVLVAAETMTGANGVVAGARPHERPVDVMARYASVHQYVDGT